MADLTNQTVFKNTKFEILTEKGFRDFVGVIKGVNTQKMLIKTNDCKTLVCTPKHKIVLSDGTYAYAKDIKNGYVLHNNIIVNSIEYTTNDDPVYEILHVNETHSYFVNGILSLQCLLIDEAAHIAPHLLAEFWKSVIPVISSSSSSKVCVVSTPNGAQGIFYETYIGAETGKLKEWHHDRIDWWDIPGRGKKWKASMMELMGKNGENFEQEFENKFLESGSSAVDSDVLNHFKKISRNPEITLEDGSYKIWHNPDPSHFYVIGVDVGEGIGQAASVCQILDITDLTNIKQAAVWHNNSTDPFHFTEVIKNLSTQWGLPYLLIERNNCGGQVIDMLHEIHHYPNLITYCADKTRAINRLGVYSTTNTKYKGIMNMRYWINSLKCVDIYDINTVNEMETFIRYPNGTWKARAGAGIHDDRVMSLVWALFALETAVADKYFNVTARDDRGKPLRIELNQTEDGKYFQMESVAIDPEEPDTPYFIIGGQSYQDGSINDLMNQGWTPANNNEGWI